MKRLLVVLLACGSKTPSAPSNVSTTPPPAPPPTFLESSPGPLSASHQPLDAQVGCNECHDGTKAIINGKCISCHAHRGLKASIDAGRGFHASPVVRGKECRLCHLEHRGHGYDLMGWQALTGGRQGFDHALSGWPLTGAHIVPKCEACHTARNKQGLTTFAGTDRLCGTCHAQQPHQVDLKWLAACDRCHAEVAWKPVRSVLKFDHNNRQDARFGLDKDHAGVACAACHPNAVFDLPATTFACVDCHPKGSPKPKRR